MHTRRVHRWLLITAGLLVAGFFNPARAGVTHDPALDWKTLHTSHFAIHFHDGAEPNARRVAAIAERVHERLTKTFTWQPEDRTDIVVTDEYDISNGNATIFPANRLNLLLAPPDEISGLEDNDGWLETLLSHEYTHILHLDKARGYPKALRHIFGRIVTIVPFLNAFPNALQQTWQIEGIAAHYETDRARGAGRGQSSYFDMLMRMEVAGGLKPVRQVNQNIDTWPGGATPYLYGSAYFDFISQTRGPDRIQALIDQYSDDFFPFLVNTASKRVFDKDISTMWDEFAVYLEAKHQPRLNTIRGAGVRAGERLSRDGYQAGPLKALPDGRAFYIAFDGRNDPALMVYRPDRKAPQELAEVHQGARLDVHPRAGVLIAQPEVCGSRYYYDLYRYDADSGSSTRLTRCARYRHAAWSPDGERIIAVHYELGESRLDLLDANGKRVETWWNGANGDVLADLDWSPDGASIVAAVWRRESGWNIEQFIISERRWRALTADAAIDGQPTFTNDGKAVLFSSDHGGVYNLRRINLAGGEITTLSNVLGGAFYPAESGTSLYYIGYGSEGFDLHRIAEPVSSATPKAAPGPSVIVEKEPPALPELRITGYEPDTGIRPRWWMPYLAIDEDQTEIGASTAGWDPLVRHIYGGTVAYDFANSTPVGAVSYIYDGWYPTLKLYASRFNNFTRDRETNDVLRMRHEDTYMAEAVLPMSSYRRDFALRLAAIADEESDATVAAGQPAHADKTDRLFGIGVTFDSTRQYPLSVSRSHGREIRLIGEDSDAYGGDYTGRVYTADWREFVALGREHVLALRVTEGFGTDNPRPFNLGGFRTDEALPPVLAEAVFASPFNRREYALRGYPSGRTDLEDRRMRLASLEYRFPVWRVERGAMVPLPIALHQLSGVVFVDSGAVWHDGQKPDDYRTGAGVELMTDTALFYSTRFSLRLGYAHGFDAGGEDQVYVRIGSAF